MEKPERKQKCPRDGGPGEIIEQGTLCVCFCVLLFDSPLEPFRSKLLLGKNPSENETAIAIGGRLAMM